MKARRVLLWVGGAVALLVLGVVLTLSARAEPAAPPALSASNPEADGAMAVAEVLRDHGVTVVETDTLADTAHEVRGASTTTILMYDPTAILDAGQHRQLLGLSHRLVVVEPFGDSLADLAPGVSEAGELDGVFEADCELTAVTQAGSVESRASAYELAAGTEGTACLRVVGDLAGLVQLTNTGTTVTVLGVGDVLRNDQVTTAGNAALALNLLGETETLIWYLPSLDDLYAGSDDSLDSLQAPWTVPVAALLLLVALAAIAWRWRRFGPLVIESLPVVARSSETMEGRARLYERGSTRLHALDGLRVGAVTRLAQRAGLPRTASVDEVIDAVAALTHRDRAEVAGILLHTEPSGDGELMALSDDLRLLEDDLASRDPGRQK